MNILFSPKNHFSVTAGDGTLIGHLLFVHCTLRKTVLAREGGGGGGQFGQGSE